MSRQQTLDDQCRMRHTLESAGEEVKWSEERGHRSSEPAREPCGDVLGRDLTPGQVPLRDCLAAVFTTAGIGPGSVNLADDRRRVDRRA